jgi:tyrosyl-tRNA synthetase
MTLSEELTWRGFVNQTTLKDIHQLDTAPLTFYWGVDPSAPSMQVGNLAMAMMVRHFIRHGHKAILLVGGATGYIGDPDGKAGERSLMSLNEIVANKNAIAEQYRQVFAGEQFEIVDNYDWFRGFGYLDFLREIGKQFSMTQLLDRDFVQSRIGKGGSGISYAEFSYSLIQGYDFLHLFRSKGVTMQVAGADQWGNSVSGVELIRKLEGQEAHIWTGPLVLNKTTGIKFGKSESGAVWLDPEMTSIFDFYQFWLNCDDKGVIDYLKIYTLLSQEEIDNLADQLRDNPSGRIAQKALAFEATKIVHGEAQARAAQEATQALFGSANNDMIPTAKITPGEYEVVELLMRAGLAASKSDARRLLSQGGVRLNQQKVTTEQVVVASGDVLQVGKRRFIRLQ